jgi:hypothetical protein
VAIQAADDEVLGRRDGRGRAEPLDDEADEGLDEDEQAGGEQDGAEDDERRPGVLRVPAVGQPPRDEADDDPGRDDEEGRAPRGGRSAPHAC